MVRKNWDSQWYSLAGSWIAGGRLTSSICLIIENGLLLGLLGD